MIKSMTGYGRFEKSGSNWKITAELRAVNHRYLDLSVRLPRRFIPFESRIRNLCKEYISRGKVDVFINCESERQRENSVKYNAGLAAEYYAALVKLGEEFGLRNDICVSGLSRYPEVLTLQEMAPDEEAVWPLLECAVRGAAECFTEARRAEGEQLERDLEGKLTHMLSCVDEVEARYPEVVRLYREKLEAKARELLGETHMDPGILATELTLYADKICVDEETVRLRSHILGMKAELGKEGVGRKLDFIAQEMNREANTILSKSGDLVLTNVAIELKTEIEKVREQVQNIE